MTREFRSSKRFRVNANGRLLDVWLLYRCAVCSQIWNYPVIERVDRKGVEPAFLDAALRNDVTLAGRYARDVSRLRRYCSGVAPSTQVRVERDAAPVDVPWEDVRLELAGPCEVRLDRLLCQVLALSRARLRQLAEQGTVQVEELRLLRRPVRHGQTLRIAIRRCER